MFLTGSPALRKFLIPSFPLLVSVWIAFFSGSVIHLYKFFFWTPNAYVIFKHLFTDALHPISSMNHINFLLWCINIFIWCWQVLLGHFYIISIIDTHGDLPCNKWALCVLFSSLYTVFHCHPLCLHLHLIKTETFVWERILLAMTFKHFTWVIKYVIFSCISVFSIYFPCVKHKLRKGHC